MLNVGVIYIFYAASLSLLVKNENQTLLFFDRKMKRVFGIGPCNMIIDITDQIVIPLHKRFFQY